MNDSKIRIKTLMAAAAMLGLGHLAPAQADVGSDTAQLLNMMYADTRQDCGSATRPAFLCSGVIFRATTPSTAYQFYSISPNAQARQGVSAAYLRKDAKMNRLPWFLESGFIFDTVMDNPADHQDYKVLCAYPIDAASDNRGQNGCGDSSLTSAVEKFCDQIGVQTSEQWVADYRKKNASHHAQCAFDVRQGQPDTAKRFYESIKARNAIAAEAINVHNELILTPWGIDAPRSPSILASFYGAESGLAGARLSQIQWYQSSRQFLPVVNMKLPKTMKEDASFSYALDKQAIYPVAEADKCSSYIQSASWIKRYDPGFKKQVASLSIVPTPCGRAVQESQTNNFFNEMVSRYYLNPEWVNNADNRSSNLASMRRQLICHFSVARGKDAYNLEPSRPATTQAATNAVGCNNS